MTKVGGKKVMNHHKLWREKVGLAEMLKGGVIMDVTTAEQAKIAAKRKQTLNSLLNQQIEKHAEEDRFRSPLRLKKQGTASALLAAISQKQSKIFEKRETSDSLPPYMQPGNLSVKKSFLPETSSQYFQKNWKTLTLFGAFSVFLIIMSHVMADPTSLLGKKVSTSEDNSFPNNKIFTANTVSSSQNNLTSSFSNIQDQQQIKEEDKLNLINNMSALPKAANQESVQETEQPSSFGPHPQKKTLLADLDPAELKPEPNSFVTDKVLSFAKTEVLSTHSDKEPLKNKMPSLPKEVLKLVSSESKVKEKKILQ